VRGWEVHRGTVGLRKVVVLKTWFIAMNDTAKEITANTAPCIASPTCFLFFKETRGSLHRNQFPKSESMSDVNDSTSFFSMKPTIVDYDPNWPVLYQQALKGLQEVLGMCKLSALPTAASHFPQSFSTILCLFLFLYVFLFSSLHTQ
jgi:hypothetical protein